MCVCVQQCKETSANLGNLWLILRGEFDINTVIKRPFEKERERKKEGDKSSRHINTQRKAH